MQTNITRKFILTLGGALLLAALAPAAQAGPGAQVFQPVKTMKQAEKLPVGATIAVSCGNCGSVTITKVDSGRSYLHGYSCPLCKRKFHVLQPGGGGRSTAMGEFVYEDEAGAKAHLSKL